MSADKDLTVCERVYGVMFNLVIPKISHPPSPRVRYSRIPSGNGTDRQMNSSRDSPKTGQPEEEVKVVREVEIQSSFSGAKEGPVSTRRSFSGEKERAVSIPGNFSDEKERAVSIPGSFSGEKERAVSIPRSVSGEKEKAASIPRSFSGEKEKAASIPGSISDAKRGEVNIQKRNSDVKTEGLGIGDVNEKADEFIRDFYNQLKRQRPEPDS